MTVKTELAWAAGFFDGEGSVRVDLRYKNPHLELKVTQCKLEPLEKFLLAVEEGNIQGPYEQKNKKHSAYWVWRVGGKAAERVTQSLWPFLSIAGRGKWEKTPYE